MNLQNQTSKTEKIRYELDELRDQIQKHEVLTEIIAKLLMKTNDLFYNLEDRVNQLEAKNNQKPKLSIEKIPPISFLSK